MAIAAKTYVSLCDKEDLIDFFHIVIDYFRRPILPRFHALHQAHHERAPMGVLPAIVLRHLLRAYVVSSEQLEVIFELVEEPFEQEILKNLYTCY